MSRRRFHRLAAAFFVVWSLLYSQLALASYACPGQADAQAMAAMMDAGVPCQGMDQQQPALCHEHAADPGKAFEPIKLPAAAAPAIVQMIELPSALDASHARAAPTSERPEVRPPPDPLFLCTLRLRV